MYIIYLVCFSMVWDMRVLFWYHPNWSVLSLPLMRLSGHCDLSIILSCCWLSCWFMPFVHENSSAHLIALVGMRVWVHEFCVLGYIYEVHFHCSVFFVLKVDLSTCLGCDACLYGACVFESFHVDSCPSLCMKIGLPTWFLWLARVFGYMSSVYLGYIYEVHFHCSIFFVLKVDPSTCLGCDACLYGSLCIWTVLYSSLSLETILLPFIYYKWNTWFFFFLRFGYYV